MEEESIRGEDDCEIERFIRFGLNLELAALLVVSSRCLIQSLYLDTEGFRLQYWTFMKGK